MKNKGFTLIELLAVIVILAIIALIAIPIVLKIVDESKESASIRSVEMYMSAAELAITRANLETEIENAVCNIEIDGNLSCDGSPITVEINGEKPKAGLIIFSKGKISHDQMWIRMSNEDVYIYRNNSLAKLDKSEENDYIISTLRPGLYDENYELVKSWDQLLTDGLDITKDYTSSDCKTDLGTGFSQLNSLTTGKILVIGNNITSIGNYAFYDCTSLTSIILPNSVTRIGIYAFYNCTNLTSINISSSVTSIGINAFLFCGSLTNITVDSNNTVYDSRNNSNAIIETSTNTLLVGCKNTVIPSSVTRIGDYAFYGSGLASITIPSSVTSIGAYTFLYCRSLANITVDSNNTVYDSRNSSNAIIETSTNTLTFGCKNTVIPSSVTTIGSAAFAGSADLANITIPSSVTSIGPHAFEGCMNLTNITISNGVKSIGEYAFQECTGLTSIYIPSSVTNVGMVAFILCDSNLQIRCGASSKPSGWHALWNYNRSVLLNTTWGASS